MYDMHHKKIGWKILHFKKETHLKWNILCKTIHWNLGNWKKNVCLTVTFFIDFSENYIVNWGKDGVPKDIEMLNNFRVVFTVSRISVLKFIVLMNSD